MELLPIIIGVQELLLAAILLYSIPAPEQPVWQADACQQHEAHPPSHSPLSPGVPTAAWSGPSGFVSLAAFGCIIGYVVGLYISKWDLRPVLHPQHSSCTNITTGYLRRQCVHYYQQCIHLGCGAIASAATASAAKLSLLAGQAAKVAAAAGEAAAAAAAKQSSLNLEVDVSDWQCCSADWAAIGRSSFSNSEAMLLSDSITLGTELAIANTENVKTMQSPRITSFVDVSTNGHAETDASTFSNVDAEANSSSCSMEVPVGNSSAAAACAAARKAAAAPALREKLASDAFVMDKRLAVQRLQQQQRACQLQGHGLPQQEQQVQVVLPVRQHQQHQQWYSPGLPSQPQQQQQQAQQQQQMLLPVCPPASNLPVSAGSTSTAAMQTQPSQTQSRANTAVTPLGCGWICVLSCSAPDEENLLQLQDPLARRQGGACKAVQQQGVPGEDISLSVVLGAGAYGKVYKGQWRGQPVAVKILYHTGSQAAAKVAEEAAIMLQAQHENVLRSHHVLMWQRPKINSSNIPSANVMSSAFPHSYNEPGQPSSGVGDSGVQGNTVQNNGSSGSSAPLCSVIQETQECEAGGWLQTGQDGIDDDDVEAQTWIVQELCDGGPLDAAIRDGRIVGMEQELACLLEIARGLEYLHSKGLVHGDLKAANVCLVNMPPDSSQAAASSSAAAAVGTRQAGSTAPSCSSSRRGSGVSTAGKDFVCKVMDFSLTKTLDPGKTHCSTHSVGTVTHVAPELLVSGKQSKAADVYSYGMMVWEVLNKGKLPYHGLHSVEVVQRVVRQQQRPDWQADADPQLVALAQQCWSADPALRPSISTVCERLLELQQAVQQVRESSLLSSTYSSTAEAAAVSIEGAVQQQQQQQLGWSLSAPLPDLSPAAAAAVHGSKSSPMLAVDESGGSTSSNSTSHSGQDSLAAAGCYIAKGKAAVQSTSAGSSHFNMSQHITQRSIWASTGPCALAGEPGGAAAPAPAAAGVVIPSPSAATADSGGFQECAIDHADGDSTSSTSSSSGDVDMTTVRQLPKRSFSFSHVLEQPAALRLALEHKGTEQDLLNLTLKAGPSQQGSQAVRPDDQPSVEVARTRVQVMLSREGPETPDSQAVRPGDQAGRDAVRTADQAGLEAVTGTWKMRRHSHGSVGKALGAAASISSAIALAALNGAVPSGAAIVAAAASGGASGATGAGSPATSIDSSALEPWEGLLVTGRKGMIRGVDCSALNDEDSSSTWQRRQQQEPRRTGAEAPVVSQNAAVASAASAGEPFGPMVGYWD